MKTSTTDKVQCTARELKGKVKEAAGRVASRPDIEAEGDAEKISGKVQRKAGEVEKVFGH